MKIFASIVGAAIAMFLAVNVDGLFGGQLSTDIDLLLCGLVGIVIAQLSLSSNDVKELRKEIAELKEKLESKDENKGTEE